MVLSVCTALEYISDVNAFVSTIQNGAYSFQYSMRCASVDATKHH